MLRRFSLYGFLKNQQYYDYFLLLAFRQMGLSFFLIGVLIAFREIMINIMEIPTGAIADLTGRRKCMIFSFIAYIISFATFGLSGMAAMEGKLAQNILMLFLFLAMFFFAIGDAFRTGTHKAMIFMWLHIQGRTDQDLRVHTVLEQDRFGGLGNSCMFFRIFDKQLYLRFFLLNHSLHP